MYPRSAKEQGQGEGGGRTQGTLVGGWLGGGGIGSNHSRAHWDMAIIYSM